MNIVKQIASKNRCYQAGRTITVRGLMLHSVGCPQPSGQVFANRMNSSGAQACVHAFVDANDGKVYQILPWNHRAWHCGSSANNTHIGVELCEPSCIRYTGGASFQCSDRQKAIAQVRTALDSAVELFAFLCKEYKLNPLADGVIISHKEGHDRGIASGHGDPDHLFRQLDMNYTMNDFRHEVAARVNGTPISATAEDHDDAPAGSAIEAGDVVSIRGNAVYYTGKAMPDWVKKDKWIVKSISGDRAVIDENTSGTHAISSPVNTKYLVKE